MSRERGEHPENSNKPPGAEEEEEQEAAVFLVLNSSPQSGWYLADDSGSFWGFKKKRWFRLPGLGEVSRCKMGFSPIIYLIALGSFRGWLRGLI